MLSRYLNKFPDGYNPSTQQVNIIKKIEHTLVEAGFSLKDVVRTRIFMTDISLWEEVAKVHSYLFEDVMPACTLVEVSNLIHSDLLIEIEATAIKEDI